MLMKMTNAKSALTEFYLPIALELKDVLLTSKKTVSGMTLMKKILTAILILPINWMI